MKRLVCILTVIMSLFGMDKEREHQEIVANLEKEAFNALESKNSEDFLIYIAALPTTEQRKKLFKTACFVYLDLKDSVNSILATTGNSLVDENDQNLIDTMDIITLKDSLVTIKLKTIKKIPPVFKPRYHAIEIERYYSSVDTLLCRKDLDQYFARIFFKQEMKNHFNFLTSENNFLERVMKEKKQIKEINLLIQETKSLEKLNKTVTVSSVTQSSLLRQPPNSPAGKLANIMVSSLSASSQKK